MVFNYETLEFDCNESFEKWLEDHQNENLTQFSKWYKKTKATYSTQRYICHRSGFVRSSVSEDSRKRRLKASGYKYLGGICPAEIRLLIRENGTCSVKYQTTHVGHSVGDESELKHMYLTREAKKRIAAEIQSGVPPREIVKRRKLSNCGKDPNRLSVIRLKDVHNIAASRNLMENDAFVSAGCDPMELMIEEHIHLVGVYPEDKQAVFADELPSKDEGDEIDAQVSYTADDENTNLIVMKDEGYQNESHVVVVTDTEIKQELIQQIESSYEEMRKNLATFDESRLQHIYDQMRAVVFESHTQN